MTKPSRKYSSTEEPKLRRIVVVICDLCLSGAGGECHVPGCILWLNRAPDMPLHPELYEDIGWPAVPR